MFCLLNDLNRKTLVLLSCVVKLVFHCFEDSLVEGRGRPRTSARVVLKAHTVLGEQTGFRFFLGHTLFLDGAHTEILSVEVLEKPLMWSQALRNHWR